MDDLSAHYDLAWLMAVKEIDRNFEGSIHQRVGFDPILCPTCRSHLKGGLCFNACHLTPEMQKRMKRLWSLVFSQESEHA